MRSHSTRQTRTSAPLDQLVLEEDLRVTCYSTRSGQGSPVSEAIQCIADHDLLVATAFFAENEQLILVSSGHERTTVRPSSQRSQNRMLSKRSRNGLCTVHGLARYTAVTVPGWPVTLQ
jgi:hypothetical protein